MRRTRIKRLRAVRLCAIALLWSLLPVTAALGSGVGRRLPPEKLSYTDPVTGLTITALTTNAANDQKIYQTHPQWTADGNWIIFRSNRSTNGTQAFAVNEANGEIIQLTDGPGNNTGTLNISRKSMKLYFLRGGGRSDQGRTQIIELDLTKLFADSKAGAMKAQSNYERVCATLPQGMRDSGGFGLDADEKLAYIGVRGGDVGTHLPAGVKPMGVPEGARMGAGPGGLRSVNLESGEIKAIIDTPFQMGHVQVNPWVPGEIVYCHETGGDAPQRMWTVMADGSGNRPLYSETPDEWVTHEAIITKDEVVFNILGHQARLRTKPTGIAVINFRNKQMKLYGEIESGQGAGETGRGFWHSNGSSDGRWLVGDTFAGNIWLINRKTGEMTLLTTGHRMRPDHCHPTFSSDSTRILIQSGRLSDGQSLDLMVVRIPDSMLNRSKLP